LNLIQWEEYVKLKNELKWATEEKLAEIKQKKKLNKGEHKEAKRMEKELEKILELEKAQKWGLEQQEKKFGAEVELKIAEFNQLQEILANKRLELEMKEREITAESDKLLSEIRQKKEMIWSEEMMINERRTEAENLRKLTEKEIQEKQETQQEILNALQMKKNELEQRENMIEAERKELERLAKQVREWKEITEFEKTELGIDELQFMQEEKDRLLKLEEKLNVLEINQEKLQEKQEQVKRGALPSIQMISESVSRDMEEKIKKIQLERLLEQRWRKQQLETIKQYEAQLLAKNIEIVHDLENLQTEFDRVKQEFEKPSESQLRIQALKNRFSKKQMSPSSASDNRRTDVDSEGLNDTVLTELTTLG